jgi:molecular chaperone GrpE (heat shock protein)
VTAPDPVAVLADAVALLRDQLDRLHRRNDELFSDARSRADDPLIRDLLLVVDSCTRIARSWDVAATATPRDVADALRAVASEVEHVLTRVGVEAFAPEPGEMFDRRQARAARVERVDDPAGSGQVTAVVRSGYRSGERVIRYAEVVVAQGPAATGCTPA